MPLVDPRDIGREQVQRQMPDLQPYYPHRYTSPPQGTSHVWGSGGYGDSPSGPYGQHFAPGGLATGPRYQTPQEPSLGNLLRSIQDLQPYGGAGSNVGSFQGVPVSSGQVSGYMATPQAMGSPSAPWAQQPARTPKPMSPFYEGPRPTIGVTRETRSPIAPGPSRRAMVQEARDYARSPSNPNWRPPGG